MGLEFLMEAVIEGDCLIVDEGDEEVFMEGLVGDIEESIRNFSQDDGWRVWILLVFEGLAEPHNSIP
jgi:hypothetical protein